MLVVSNVKSRIAPEAQQTDYIVGSDLLANLHKIGVIAKRNVSCFLLLSDETVFKLYGQKVLQSLNNLGKDIAISVIPPGEKSKDIRILPKIIKPFFQKGFDRESCLIALGGGVVTDVGGFLSSILLRGIEYINIPTTLLGQVDAAIGGKTGVDFWVSQTKMYKNMIGKIEQPKMVISDVETLKTLPEKEILNGLGEMVKYWVGWGKPTKYQISNIKYQKDLTNLTKTITECQRIKSDVVSQDPFETKGVRQKLNLGHTIGHAIEGTSNGRISHGEAVSIGLIAAAKISLMLKMLSYKNYKLITTTINKLGLPTTVSGIDIDMVKKALKMDKKAGTFVLIYNISKLEVGVKVEKDLIDKVLKELII